MGGGGGGVMEETEVTVLTMKILWRKICARLSNAKINHNVNGKIGDTIGTVRTIVKGQTSIITILKVQKNSEIIIIILTTKLMAVLDLTERN